MQNKTQLAALVIQVSKKLPVLEAVVSQSPLLDEGLPKALALVLVHEALFGVRPLPPGMCARSDQVLACRPQLEKALADVSRKGKGNTDILGVASCVMQAC